MPDRQRRRLRWRAERRRRAEVPPQEEEGAQLCLFHI
jgi:hypothetical protein